MRSFIKKYNILYDRELLASCGKAVRQLSRLTAQVIELKLERTVVGGQHVARGVSRVACPPDVDVLGVVNVRLGKAALRAELMSS